jgi:AraC-like DNA-binding protein
MPSTKGIETRTLPMGALFDLPEVMLALKHDPWPLLAEFGIDSDALAMRKLPLPVAVVGQILQAAAKSSGREHLGLLLGEAAALDNVGELRFLLLNASTVGQAVDHLARFVKLTHQSLRPKVEHRQGYTSVAIGLVEEVPGADQMLVAYSASFVKALRTIIGPQWNPSIVHLALRKPRLQQPYRRFFRAPVLFDQTQYAILFPDALLDSPCKGGDPRLAEFIFERLCALEAHAPRDLVAQVQHAVEMQLLRGECNAVRIARIFSIHRKTLHGYLRELGTSFEMLRDETRSRLAVRMLEHTDLLIADIATTLGYGSQAGLTRAFRRWHGRSPSEWRRQSVGRLAVTRAAKRGIGQVPGRR